MATVASPPIRSQTVTADVFSQKPLKGQSFQVTIIHERDLYSSTKDLDTFFQSVSSETAPLGLAGAYVECTKDALRDGSAYLLTKLAVSTPDKALVIELHFEDENNPADTVDHTVLYNTFFNPDRPLPFVGFNLDRLALQLFGEYGMHLYNGIDIFSLKIEMIHAPRGTKSFLKAWKTDLDLAGMTELLENEIDAPSNDPILASRAWVGAVLYQASERLALSLAAATPINTSLLKEEELIELKKTLLSSDRLRGAAPDFQQHEIEVKRRGKVLFAVSQQFNSRIRLSDYDLELTFEEDVINAKVKSVKGKSAELILPQSVDLDSLGALLEAKTLGKEDATTLDNQRSNFILFALQGKVAISGNPLLSRIWFPSSQQASSDLPPPNLMGAEYERLNNSQKEAVEEMMKEGDDARIVLVHGPPGTGKTSVIAAMTQCLLAGEESQQPPDNTVQDSEPRLRMDEMTLNNALEIDEDEELARTGPTVWIVAQSNVAVKNVAEKLVKIGIESFKLIVSKEFHFEWHEHIYTKVKENMCITANLPKSSGEVATFLGSSRVVLCTLSMLTHPMLRKLDFYKHMPMNNVVVDEASQIQLGDLLPLLHLHGSDITRLCLVGDHKQLAPYGQEEVQEIESIFEKPHIVKDARLLKITYRLPKPISNIISSEVYDSRLIPFSQEERVTCCKWLDIQSKEVFDGASYYNPLEVDAAILLAKELAAKGKDYRIISPYATQSSKILAKLKEEDMKWEDKCFNVDSFQGNEADYIILSLVRTEAMGFLDNNRRANVALSRCKKGMFVLCSKDLMMRDHTRKTLFGKFAYTWNASQDNQPWITYDALVDGCELVDEDLNPISSVDSQVMSHKAARAEKNGRVKGKGKRQK